MVYVLGCDHYLQEYDRTEPDDSLWESECAAKRRFYEIAKGIIEAERIQFVGEECRPDQKTIPRALAAEVRCSYAEIDMAPGDREKRGIARNYQEMGDHERDRVYAIREDHMVERVYSESTVEMRKLLVCGAEHIKGLLTRLVEHGEEPVLRDLTKEDWVLEIYKKKEEFLLGRVRR